MFFFIKRGELRSTFRLSDFSFSKALVGIRYRNFSFCSLPCGYTSVRPPDFQTATFTRFPNLSFLSPKVQCHHSTWPSLLPCQVRHHRAFSHPTLEHGSGGKLHHTRFTLAGLTFSPTHSLYGITSHWAQGSETAMNMEIAMGEFYRIGWHGLQGAWGVWFALKKCIRTLLKWKRFLMHECVREAFKPTYWC